jgi:transcriptional antiterminator NusG
VVHAYSGYEKKVALAIEERIAMHTLQEKFGDIMVPTEEVIEMKGGQKRTSERKFFPGYVLVNMELDDETWHLVKETPRVTLYCNVFRILERCLGLKLCLKLEKW